MRYYILGLVIGVAISACTGCGNGAESITKVGGANSAAVIVVSLNDAWTAVTPNGSEKVELADARYFTPPSAVTVVQGAYAGMSPGQYLHAKILVGAEQCEYQNTGINDPSLTLTFCSGGLGPNSYLPAGTQIELVNHDAPGYLLQADFMLVR